MSGGISLPYLFNRGNSKLAGFIAVAPVGGPDPSNIEKFKKVEVPLQIVYGEEDKNLGVKGAKVMQNAPNHEIVVIPNGKHPCYLDNPDLWHEKLISFIERHWFTLQLVDFCCFNPIAQRSDLFQQFQIDGEGGLARQNCQQNQLKEK